MKNELHQLSEVRSLMSMACIENTRMAKEELRKYYLKQLMRMYVVSKIDKIFNEVKTNKYQAFLVGKVKKNIVPIFLIPH